MHSTSPSRPLSSHHRSMPARWALAVAFGLMLGATLAYVTIARATSLLALASLQFSKTSIATGTAATGTVTLDGIPTKLTTVTLTSGNTQIVTVPASVTVSSPKMLGTFQAQSVGGAAGCTSITARLGTVAKSSMIHVLPPVSGAPVKLTVPDVAVTGQNKTGQVTLINVPTGTHTVQLTSSNPAAATVPASVTVTATLSEVGVVGAATFPITTTPGGAETCAVISATRSGTTARALIKLVPISG